MSLHSLIVHPHWVIGYGSITQHQLYISSCSSPLSSFSSIHPDYTSNGSSSQQPPTVMELCLNEQPCLSTPPFFPLLLSPPPSLKMHAHTFAVSNFHLQKAVCTLNSPMHSTPLGHMRGEKRKIEERKHYCQIFRFRVFILYALSRRREANKRCRGLAHIYSVRDTLFNRKDSSSSPALPCVSTRKCFYNRSHLALFFDFTPLPPPPPARLYLSLQVSIVTLFCSLSLSSGKIILPSSNLHSLISDRGEMNKGSKEPFSFPFFTLSGYIYSGSPWLSTMAHTPITHDGLFSFLGPGVVHLCRY